MTTATQQRTIFDYIHLAKQLRVLKSMRGATEAVFCNRTLYISPAMHALMDCLTATELEELIKRIPVIESHEFQGKVS